MKPNHGFPVQRGVVGHTFLAVHRKEKGEIFR